MKLFQGFILAFLLSFNTLTNSIFAADNGSDTEQGDSNQDAEEPGEGEGEEGEEPEEAEEESGE